MIASEIMLPPHAPEIYLDRATLWNAVESCEKHPKAQLAYSFDIAMQNELTLEENMELARKFVQEQFVAKGMIADLAFHNPEKEDGGIPNPHFHVMTTMRPLNPDGTWGQKQRREYLLDEDGNRIRDKNGDYMFNAVHTTDWHEPETLEHWREQWAAAVNTKFEEKGLDVRIDHRSYVRQGLDLIPTVHEGANVRQMEAKGIRTEKGELNRWIKATNRLIQDVRKKMPSMKVDSRFYCFGCGASGDVIDFSALLHGLGKREAAVRLAEDFGVSYEKSGNAPPDRKRHNRSQPRQKSAEQRFQETERYCFRVLCDYLRLLEHWKTAYAPQPQDAIWHPLFVEALQRISYTEYLLDILLYGEIEEKAALIAAQGKEVLRLEQRISEIAAGNAGSGQKDDGHNGTGADTSRNPGDIRGDAERRREEQHPKLPDGVPA